MALAPRTAAALTLAALLAAPAIAPAADSTCHGTVSRGRLEGGVPLPTHGRNFQAFSRTASLAGRMYVHAKVREIVEAAYGALELTAPGKVFVLGESGWKSGGRIRPHRTHQNGLSVDFMVPVLDREGRSAPLPTTPFNKFGYGMEFDASGRDGHWRIDFEAVGEHLYQLDVAARGRGVGLALVIFDPRYLPRLFATPRGAYLKRNVRFLARNAWVRHDEHYHVDFAIPCAGQRRPVPSPRNDPPGAQRT